MQKNGEEFHTKYKLSGIKAIFSVYQGKKAIDNSLPPTDTLPSVIFLFFFFFPCILFRSNKLVDRGKITSSPL